MSVTTTYSTEEQLNAKIRARKRIDIRREDARDQAVSAGMTFDETPFEREAERLDREIEALQDTLERERQKPILDAAAREKERRVIFPKAVAGLRGVVKDGKAMLAGLDALDLIGNDAAGVSLDPEKGYLRLKSDSLFRTRSGGGLALLMRTDDLRDAIRQYLAEVETFLAETQGRAS